MTVTLCCNPVCPRPQNPKGSKFCITCGARLLLGDRYGAFSLVGGGGSSRTYWGLDTHQLFDSRCIIKVFTPSSDTLEALDRQRREFAVLATLSEHPQLPDLYAYFERQNRQYLVQEFVDGRNLLQQLQQEGSFSDAQIRTLLHDCLPLLDFLHQHQIIHRDIKPTNLIDRGNEPIALVDFGAAKQVTQSALANTGTVLGSAEYTAPEQLVGKAIYASDLYSLGVTCIHLLTGLRPFELFDSASGNWFWRSVAGEVSAQLAEVLDRMICMTANDRYPSAQAVMQALGITVSPSMAHAARPAPATPSVAQWQRYPFAISDTAINAIAVSTDNCWLASGGNDRTIRCWRMPSLEAANLPDGGVTSEPRSQRLEGHHHAIAALAFTPNSQFLLSASWDKTLQLWDVGLGQHCQTLEGHQREVTCVAISRDGTLAVSGSRDGSVRLWQLPAGTAVGTLDAQRAPIEAIALGADGQTLVSGDARGEVKVWQLGTREMLRTLSGHGATVSALALSRDGQTLVSSSWDMTIQVRNVHTGAVYHSLRGHLLPISCLSIDADDQVLATGSQDGTVKLWQFHQGRLLTTLETEVGAVESLMFFGQGRAIAVAGQNGAIELWCDD